MRKMLAVLIACAAVTAVRGERFNLDVYASKFDSIPIAVLNFRSLSGTALAKDEPWQVIANDLTFTGRFDVLRSEKIDTAAFARRNIGVYIDGDYTAGENSVSLDCFLKDAATGEQIITRTYRGTPKTQRSIAHRFANEIVEIILSDKGIFTSRIAFVKDLGAVKEIGVMDYDGFNVQPVTRSKTINIFPAFADSTTLIWASYAKGKPDLYKGSIAGGKPAIFMWSRGIHASPSVCPIDGKIAFGSSRNGSMDVFVCDPDGSNLKQLTSNKAVNTSPAWSPNGYQIAFTSDRSGGPQIYAMDKDGANVKRVTFEGSYADSPAWSPKGDRIAYQSMTDGKFDIWTVNPDATGATRITSAPGNNEYPCWSPDGSHIAFSSKRGAASDICCMRADGSEVTKITQSGNVKMPDWSAF